MDRRTFLRSVGVAAAPLSALEGAVNAVVGPAYEASTTAGTTAIGPAIWELRYPLAFVPAILEPGETLRVEPSPEVDDPTAFLRRQVGTARPETELELRNDLAVDVSGASVFSLRDCPVVRVEGGHRLWRRRHGGRQDLEVADEVPVEGTATLVVECRGR